MKGIPKILAANGLTWEELGITLAAPSSIGEAGEDMPLVEIPEGATAERSEPRCATAAASSSSKAMDKYLFDFEPLCMPDGLIVEDDRLVGLRFRRTEDGRMGGPFPTDETFERRGALT